MALVQLAQPLYFPTGIPFGDYLFGNHTFDAAGDAVGWVFDVPDTGTLTAVAFSCSSHTTTATMSCEIHTLDNTNGLPTGTLYDANATGTVSVSAVANYQIAINGGTGISVTAGDQIVPLLFVASGTPSFNIQTGLTLQHQTYSPDYPYGLVNPAGNMTDPQTSLGTLALDSDESPIAYAVEIDSVWYPCGGPYGALAQIAAGNDFYGTGSAHDTFGMRLKPNFAGRAAGINNGLTDGNDKKFDCLLTAEAAATIKT